MRSGAALAASQAFRVALQFVSVVVLARLLGPGAFGVAAMVGPLVAFSLLLQDFGIPQLIVARLVTGDEELARLFRLSLRTAFAAACGVALLGPIAAWFFHDGRLRALCLAYGAPVLLTGATSVPAALLARDLRFGVLARLESAAAAVGLMVAVVFAAWTHSFWALWLSTLASSSVLAMGVWRAAGFRPARAASRGRTPHLTRRSGEITAANFCGYLARNLDNLLVGRVSGEAALGLYDRAYKLLLFPLQNVNAPTARVVTPILARLRDEPERMREVYLLVSAAVTLATAPGVAAAVGAPDSLIRLALGPRWAGVAPIFAWLGVAGLAQAFNTTTGWLFVVQGRTRAALWVTVSTSAIAAASFGVGVHWGPVGVAAAYAVSGWLLRTPIILVGATRRGPVRLADIVNVQGVLALGALATIVAGRFLLTPRSGALQLLAYWTAAYLGNIGLTACTRAGRDLLLRLARLRKVLTRPR